MSLPRLVDRLKFWQGRSLVPEPLRLFDRWLLLHHPQIWRSRLLWVAPLCFVLTVAAWWTAKVPMTPETVWTAGQIDAVVGYVQLLELIGLGFWLVLALRHACAGGALGAWLKAGACATLVALLLMLPGIAAREVLNGQVAGVLPNVDIRQHMSVLERFGRLCVPPEVDAKKTITRQLRDNLPQFEETLRRFGLELNWIDRELDIRLDYETGLVCARVFRRLAADAETSAWNLLTHIDRVQSEVSTAGTWRRVAAREWALVPIVLLGVGIPAAMLLHPPGGLSAYATSLLARGWHRPLARPGRRPWQWLRAIDRRWLMRRPALWASGIHLLFSELLIVVVAVYAFWLLLAAGRDAVGVATLWESVLGDGTASSLAVISVVALAPLLWFARYRRHDIHATGDSALRWLVSVFAMATVLPASLIAVAFSLTKDSVTAIDILFAVSHTGMIFGFHLLSATLVVNFVGIGSAVAGVALSLPLTFATLALKVSGAMDDATTVVLPTLLISGGWLAGQLKLHRMRAAFSVSMGRRRRMMASLLVSLAPAAALQPEFLVTGLAVKGAGQFTPWIGEAASELVVLGIGTLLKLLVLLLVYRHLIMPSLRVLSLSRVVPHEQ